MVVFLKLLKKLFKTVYHTQRCLIRLGNISKFDHPENKLRLIGDQPMLLTMASYTEAGDVILTGVEVKKPSKKTIEHVEYKKP